MSVRRSWLSSLSRARSSRLLPSLPTRTDDWRLVGRTARLVLGIPTYAAVAVLAALASLTVFVWLRNLDLLWNVVLTGSVGPEARLSVLVGLYPWVGAAYTSAQSVLLTVTAALVGVDVALVGYHVREHGLALREGSGGATGVILGTLGAGCAACGSVFLAGLLSLVGAGGAMALLPLDGLEFALVAVVVLVLSIYWLAEGLRGGTIRGCPVEV